MNSSGSEHDATRFVYQCGKELGFATVGITDTKPPSGYKRYQSWLQRGDHGNMTYMADPFHVRARRDMRELLPNAKSAIVVALSYPKANHSSPPPEADARGRIAQYAIGDDYHYVIKKKLGCLADALADFVGHPVASRACVDSAPILERELAERAGIGFIGKNTMLIAPGVGSYLLLGVLLTDIEFPPSTPTVPKQHCGTCTACLDACPTQAFRGPFQLNATRCISYLTIENRAPIPESLRSQIGDRIFGCDECQVSCPYNKMAPQRQPIPPSMLARDEHRASPGLSMLAKLGSNQRKRYVDGSPLRRNNRDQMLRNVAVSLGNVDTLSDTDQKTLETLADSHNPTVRQHALFALQMQKR